MDEAERQISKWFSKRFHSEDSPLKIAVFQVDIGEGAVHLLCVPTSSFKAACELEAWLSAHVEPQCLVKFLGRYDRVQTFTTAEEVKSALERNSSEDPRGTVVSIETAVKRLLSHR
jgi:hypothetical protein